MSSDGVKRSVVCAEASYEVPIGHTSDELVEVVLMPFGSTIDSSFVEIVDGKHWVVTSGAPVVLDGVDVAYLAWRSKLEQ